MSAIPQRFTDGIRQVDAMYYDGMNGKEIREWGGGSILHYGACRPLGIRSEAWVSPGDWIVCDNGIYRACSSDEFDTTYRPA